MERWMWKIDVFPILEIFKENNRYNETRKNCNTESKAGECLMFDVQRPTNE